MHEVMVTFRLTEADQALVENFRQEMTRELLATPGSRATDAWTREEAIIAIFGVGLQRIRLIQAMAEPQRAAPVWLEHLVADSLRGVK